MNMKIVCGFLFVSLFCISLVSVVHAVNADSNNGILFDSGVYLISPINQTYTINHIPLYFTFDCAGSGIDYNLTYALDGEYSAPITLVMNGSAANAPTAFSI
jgi:hypothetical protein